MFSKLFVALVCVSSVFATPLAVRRDISNTVARRDVSPINARSSNQSFNRWRGFEALAGFDDFNGIDDFDGSRRDQVVVIQEERLVCQAVDVRIIQQQLVILQEFAKQIVTQQICEVEVQTIILSQLEFGIRDFGRDVRRESNRQVGFDQDIAALLALLLNQDGSINVNDYGFDGRRVGDKTVVVEGNNWDDAKSPEAVKAAREAAEAAAKQEEEDAAAQEDQANDEAAQDDQAAADEAAKAEQEAADQAAADEAAKAEQAKADEAAKAEQAAAEQAAAEEAAKAEEAAQAEAPAAEEAAPVERRFRSMRRSSRK